MGVSRRSVSAAQPRAYCCGGNERRKYWAVVGGVLIAGSGGRRSVGSKSEWVVGGAWSVGVNRGVVRFCVCGPGAALAYCPWLATNGCAALPWRMVAVCRPVSTYTADSTNMNPAVAWSSFGRSLEWRLSAWLCGVCLVALDCCSYHVV